MRRILSIYRTTSFKQVRLGCGPISGPHRLVTFTVVLGKLPVPQSLSKLLDFMKRHILSIQILAIVAIFFISGCASEEPQTIELSDDYLKLYDDYDNDFQSSEGEADRGK